MAADYSSEDEERQGLTSSFRTQMGYGTAPSTAIIKKSAPVTRKFIYRKVNRTDTLMGIALKYGVTVGDLKRENKLWNSDHLFLREHLLIPLTAENENALDVDNDTIVVYNGTTVVKASTSSPSASQPHLPNGSSNSDSLPSSSSSRSASKKSSRSQSNGSDPDAIESAAEPKTNASEFFNKYDNSIARLKGDVAKLGKNAAAGKSMASEIRVSVSSSISSRSSTSSYHMVNDEIEFVESETCC